MKLKIVAMSILAFFAMLAAYYFTQFAASERLFLGYSMQSTDAKNVAIELKGKTFFISKEEAEDHKLKKELFYGFFLAAVVSMGVVFKIDSKIKERI